MPSHLATGRWREAAVARPLSHPMETTANNNEEWEMPDKETWIAVTSKKRKSEQPRDLQLLHQGKD